ncbi:MAG TPA: endonuclease/exonuclease/phosphatase family protein [Kofleriaceae bacterium]|jgi:endonuclease/exonuclease/phosphatase family metal-dependent hydrolase|nr:endonuclease/exonuclease/phosphatase family protein [Kofleriaceae bacterium]
MKIRVLTYNIHKCIGGVDRRYDLDRTVETIRHFAPDVALLQEVDAGARRSNGDHQVELLADRLGLHHFIWFPNVKIRGGGQYGNAVISRFPLEEHRNIDLTVAPRKRRSVLHAVARVRHDGHERHVHVYNMHLGLSQYERRIQLGTFLDSHPFYGLHHDTPVIVGGDLNDVWGNLGPLLAPSGFRGLARCPRTFPAWGPLRALDSIYVRGKVAMLGLHRGETELCKRASDHRPLYADLMLETI